MPSVTRRTFLRQSGVLAAAAPLILPARLAGASPAERLAVGCIGIGGMGGGHLGHLLRTPELVVRAVCDVDRGKREAARSRVDNAYADATKAGTYQGCAAYVDFRELLARADLDAVVIATPDHWHASLVAAAAMAGKDVYCEKPLTLTIGEARDLIPLVRRYGCVLQTGSQQRSEYQGRFRLACELVRNGRIGRLLTAHVTVGGPSGDCFLPPEPVPAGLDRDMWIGPAPWRPYHAKLHPASWRSYRDYSGGGMTDWGAHHFDIVQWALNMDESGPVEIIPPHGGEVERLTYRYANGVEVYHGGYRGEGSNGITFTGTEGRIDVCREALKTYPESLLADPLRPSDVHLYRSPGHLLDWIQCMRTRRRPVCDVSIGAHSVTVCHLGNLAYWLQRPLRWDAAAWRFVNDPAADRWIDRAKRAPWALI